jgi:hypothetical protein
MKFAIIFLYSTTLTVVLWLLMHADTPWTWVLLTPLIALGVALSLLDLSSPSAGKTRFLKRIADEGRHLWRWRG